MISVLSIDADVAFSRLLSIYLQSEGGFFLNCISDGAQACDLIADQGFDVILLESELPGISGFEILRSIRRCGDLTPVIMFTARGDNLERFRALDDQADMYLPKSARLAELSESIRVLHYGLSSFAPDASHEQLPQLSLDAARLRAHYRGHLVPLSETEFRVLEVLVRRPGATISRADIAANALSRESGRPLAGVEQCINSLRKKLGPGTNGRQTIRGAAGKGYTLNVEGLSE